MGDYYKVFMNMLTYDPAVNRSTSVLPTSSISSNKTNSTSV